MPKDTQKTQLKRQKKQEMFIEAFRKTLGNITQSCNACGISRSSYYKWLKQKEFSIAIQSIEEEQKDFVESKLLQLIDEKNPSAIIFYLKTKAKDRGYSEILEHKFNEDVGIDIVVFK